MNQIQTGQAGWELFLNGIDITAEVSPILLMHISMFFINFQYQHFIVINCGRQHQNLSDDLCSFTNSSLANQMIYNVMHNNTNPSQIRRAHIMHTQQQSSGDSRCIVPQTQLNAYKCIPLYFLLNCNKSNYCLLQLLLLQNMACRNKVYAKWGTSIFERTFRTNIGK